MTQQTRTPQLAGEKMMRPDEAEDYPPSDPNLTASSATTDSGTAEEKQAGASAPQPASKPQPASTHGNVNKTASPAAPVERNGRKSRNDPDLIGSSPPQGLRGKAPPVAISTRSMKRGQRGHSPRLLRGHGGKAKSTHASSARAPTGGNLPRDRAAAPKEVPKERTPPKAPEISPSSPPLEARRSTYFSICLNASPDELTVVSYNLRMENSCCPFDDNWRRREAALYRYLLSLEDSHHPDVLLIQGAYSSSTLRLLKSLVKEEPIFPFQTRVVGGDPGCCKSGDDEGGCTCPSSCWYCLPLPSRKSAKKGIPAAFVTNNGWDSVCGKFSRFRGNGGIVVMSKWPILRRHAYIFATSVYPQSLSNAGAALVQVEKCGKVYNVLAMQLQPGASNNTLRVAQVKEVMAWARTGMEDAEKVEFASCDIDGALASSADVSTRSESYVMPTDASKKGDRVPKEGLPELIHSRPRVPPKRTHRSGSAELPKGILKATDPLIIGGNLNFRFSEDRAFLAEALGADGFRATLALEDASVAQPSFDTVNNDTCYLSQGCPQQPTQELLDYLLIYSDHAGRVARGQRTLVSPAPDKILYRPVVLGCMPCSATEVSHVSDFFPVCATFAHTTGT